MPARVREIKRVRRERARTWKNSAEEIGRQDHGQKHDYHRPQLLRRERECISKGEPHKRADGN